MTIRSRIAAVGVVVAAALAATVPVGGAHAASDPAGMTSSSGATLKPTASTPVNTAGSTGSLGPSADPQAIFGSDNRVRVTNTTAFPHRAIGLITSPTASCTGALVGADTVITAGQCVHSGARGAFRSGIKFYPGRNGNSAPYGYCVPRAGGLFVQNGWKNSSDERFDVAVIKLSCTIGQNIGWFGYFSQPSSFNGVQVALRGYNNSAFLMTQNAPINITQQYQLFFQHDSDGAQAGAPLFHNRSSNSPYCTGECILAVNTHTTHGSAAPHSTYNHGGRITNQVRDFITSVRNM